MSIDFGLRSSRSTTVAFAVFRGSRFAARRAMRPRLNYRLSVCKAALTILKERQRSLLGTGGSSWRAFNLYGGAFPAYRAVQDV